MFLSSAFFVGGIGDVVVFLIIVFAATVLWAIDIELAFFYVAMNLTFLVTFPMQGWMFSDCLTFLDPYGDEIF